MNSVSSFPGWNASPQKAVPNLPVQPPVLAGVRKIIRPPCHPHCKAKLWSELKPQVLIIYWYLILFLAKSIFFSVKTGYKLFITVSPQAKEVFEKICPDEEFLQPVPNPEDIILDDFLQDANQNATEPGLDARADAVDPDSGVEPPALTTEQDQAEGSSGVSNQLSGEESPVLEQDHACTNGGERSQPSEEESQSGTAPSDT